jgi:p-hydroxybenzoate 3-monooxygenase
LLLRLANAGIDNTIVQQRSADYVLRRIRFGVLEQVTVDLLDELAGARMRRRLPRRLRYALQAMPHDLHGLTRQARDGLRPD